MKNSIFSSYVSYYVGLTKPLFKRKIPFFIIHKIFTKDFPNTMERVQKYSIDFGQLPNFWGAYFFMY